MCCGNVILFYDMLKCFPKRKFVSNFVCVSHFVMLVCTSLPEGGNFLTVSTVQEGSCYHQLRKLSHQHVLVSRGGGCLISGAAVPVIAIEDHTPRPPQSTLYYLLFYDTIKWSFLLHRALARCSHWSGSQLSLKWLGRSLFSVTGKGFLGTVAIQTHSYQMS